MFLFCGVTFLGWSLHLGTRGASGNYTGPLYMTIIGPIHSPDTGPAHQLMHSYRGWRSSSFKDQKIVETYLNMQTQVNSLPPQSPCFGRGALKIVLMSLFIWSDGDGLFIPCRYPCRLLCPGLPGHLRLTWASIHIKIFEKRNLSPATW